MDNQNETTEPLSTEPAAQGETLPESTNETPAEPQEPAPSND